MLSVNACKLSRASIRSSRDIRSRIITKEVGYSTYSDMLLPEATIVIRPKFACHRTQTHKALLRSKVLHEKAWESFWANLP